MQRLNFQGIVLLHLHHIQSYLVQEAHLRLQTLGAYLKMFIVVSLCDNVNQLGAGNDKVFEFLENVLTEVIDLFPSNYIHIGG